MPRFVFQFGKFAFSSNFLGKKFNDKTLSSGYSLKRLLADKADTPNPGLTPILASPVRIFSKCFYWPLASPGPCWRPQPVHFSCSPLSASPCPWRAHDRKLAFVIYHHHEWEIRCQQILWRANERFYFSLTAWLLQPLNLNSRPLRGGSGHVMGAWGRQRGEAAGEWQN